MYIYHVLYITIYKHSGTLSQVSCPLVASPTERDQHCDLCVTQGGNLWHIPYFPQKPMQVKYHCCQLRWSWTSMVTKHPLNEKETPTLTTCLCTALAKSHWLPHNPLMNSGVTGPMTKQDYTGVPKISALTVPTASGTVKNMPTPTHCAAAQPIKPITKQMS